MRNRPAYTQHTAACRAAGLNPDLWHSPNRYRRAEAKAICNNRCPIFDLCLQYALEHDVSGVWAGTTEKERNALRDDLGIAPEDMSTEAWMPNWQADDPMRVCSRGHEYDSTLFRSRGCYVCDRERRAARTAVA